MNVNDKVRVKLTSHGYIALSLDGLCPYTPDGDHYLECPLWELMRVFGAFMFMGNPNLPFEPDFEIVS